MTEQLSYCCDDFKSLADDYYLERIEGHYWGLSAKMFGEKHAQESKRWIPSGWYFMDREGVPDRIGSPLKLCPWCGAKV